MSICPNCGTELDVDEIDIGVGIIEGNIGCPNCYWTPRDDIKMNEDEEDDEDFEEDFDEDEDINEDDIDEEERYESEKIDEEEDED